MPRLRFRKLGVSRLNHLIQNILHALCTVLEKRGDGGQFDGGSLWTIPATYRSTDIRTPVKGKSVMMQW